MVSRTRKLGKSHLSRSGDEAKYPVFGATRLVAVPGCLARGERPRQTTLRPAIGALRSTRDNQRDNLGLAQLAEGGASPTLWVRSGWEADLSTQARVKAACEFTAQPKLVVKI